MNRRAFLALCGGAAVIAPTLVAAAPAPVDEFSYRGWRLRWRGWREPVNQSVMCGFWTANRDDDARGWYATTMGVIDRAYDMDALDMTTMNGWPRPSLVAVASPEVRDALKLRTRDALMERLDG